MKPFENFNPESQLTTITEFAPELQYANSGLFHGSAHLRETVLIQITPERVAQARYNPNILRTKFRDDFAGTLQVEPKILPGDIKLFCDYFFPNKEKEKTLSLDFSKSDLNIAQIKQIMRELGEQYSENQIKITGIKINPPQENFQEYVDFIRDNAATLTKVSSNPSITVNRELIDLIIPHKQIDISGLYLDTNLAEEILTSLSSEKRIAVKQPSVEFLKLHLNRLGGFYNNHHEYNGTKEVPIKIDDKGVVISCHEYRSYSDFAGGIVIEREYKGNQKFPVTFDKENCVKFCTAYKVFARNLGHHFLDREYFGNQDCPISFEGFKFKYSRLIYYDGTEVSLRPEYEYIGTKEHQVVFDYSPTKSCYEYRSHNYSDGRVVTSVYSGIKEMEASLGIHRVSSCDEFYKTDDNKKYFDCNFTYSFKESLRSLVSNRVGTPFKCAACCEYDEKGYASKLTIYSGRTAVMEFFRDGDSNNLKLTSYRNGKVPEKLQELSLDPKDINAEFIKRVQTAYNKGNLTELFSPSTTPSISNDRGVMQSLRSSISKFLPTH